MKTLLDGVNEVLKNTKKLSSGSGLLTSLTDSARQVFIDTAVQKINEAIDELYSYSNRSKPKQMKESSITLEENERDYSLHSQLVTLRSEFHLIDKTNNHVISILGEDGYQKIIHGDIEQDDTGLPHVAAINPIDGRLILDRLPTASDAGRVYTYWFDKDLELTDKDDQFPFSDAVFRALVPAAAELFRLVHHQSFDANLFNRSMSRAVRFLNKLPPRSSWIQRRSDVNATDPLSDPTVS